MGRRVWESAGEWAGECGIVQVSGQESVGECG